MKAFKLLKSDSATATRLPAQMLAFDHAWHSTCWSGVCATEPSLGTVNVNGDSVGLFVVFFHEVLMRLVLSYAANDFSKLSLPADTPKNSG